MLDTAVVSKIHTRRQKEIKKGKRAFSFENLERITTREASSLQRGGLESTLNIKAIIIIHTVGESKVFLSP